MTRASQRQLLAAGIALAGAGTLGAIWLSGRDPAPGTAPAEVIAAGAALYAGHCASCHGANLEGQPDWRSPLPSGRLPAPPHDASGHTWHHADDLLFRIVKEGTAAVVGDDYETDMAGFGGVLRDDEIRAILAFIKSTWPDRERAHQAAISAPG